MFNGKHLFEKVDILSPMASHNEVGKIGEEIAEKFLVDRGWRIIERNASYPFGEIDLIAKDKFGILVFVEVKTLQRSGSEFFSLQPEDNMTRSKILKLKKTAEFYANKNPKSYHESGGWRIDFLGILLPRASGDNLTELYKNCEIKYLENIA